MPTLESFGMSELNELMAVEARPCIAIYVPTAQSGRETLAGSIHLKNLLHLVEAELKRRDLNSRAISDMLEPVGALVDDQNFWQHQGGGLAIFIAEGVLRMFRLPISVPARQSVGDLFAMTPLLPMLSGDGRFYVLALSENEVRLLEATRYGSTRVQVDGVPPNMDAIRVGGPEKQQQRYGGPAGSSTYFGSGGSGGSQEHNEDLKRYFDRVDAALTPYFHRHPAPMVLAGVEHLLPIYRSANTDATILDGAVTGNQDRASDDELHRAAWNVAAPHFAAAQSEAMARFDQLLSSGGASADTGEIEAAADAGRVATLFVAENDHSPSANRAAMATITQGGEVFVRPSGSQSGDPSLAATFRY